MARDNYTKNYHKRSDYTYADNFLISRCLLRKHPHAVLIAASWIHPDMKIGLISVYRTRC